MRLRPAARLLMLLVAVLALAGCSGIPGSSQVQDVGKVDNQVNQLVPATPAPGTPPDGIVRGFISAAARISLAGSAGSTYLAPQQYLTARAQKTWQKNPEPVIILADLPRIVPSPDDPSSITISGAYEGTVDRDKAYHASDGGTYQVTVHLVKENGQWRINDPPAELLIRQSDFNTVFFARTLYFLDASHTEVVPDRRYLIVGSQDNRVYTLMTLLLGGPAGVLKGAAQSELTGGSLRTNPSTDSAGLTHVDLSGITVPTPADRNALAAQIVWTLYAADVGQVAISLNGLPLDPAQKGYTLSTMESFSPDRVPGTGSVASDPYFIAPSGAVVDLLNSQPMYGQIGTGSVQIVSAAMSAATGTVAAVSQIAGSQQLLIGQPLNHRQTEPALKANTLSQPSFSRSGDEVWVVQNGNTNPEIIRISTSSTATGVPSRAKVGAVGLVGKGDVSALALSPDGVRVAIIADGHLYVGAITTPASSPASISTGATTDSPDALTVTNLQELRGDLVGVDAVAFRNANELLVVSNSGFTYRSISDMKIDGFDLTAVTTSQLNGDVQAIAVSVVDADADAAVAGAAVAGGGIFITFNGSIWKLTGSLTDGEWVSAGPGGAMLSGGNPFYPN